MPELIEIEYYRQAAEAALGRTISSIETPDAAYMKRLGAADFTAALIEHRIEALRRIGKLLLADLSSGPVLGMRFGMTGRIIVDDHAPIDVLEYSSDRNEPAWDRFVVNFADGGSLRMRDPRRLGGVELDPDESALGVEASTVTEPQLRALLGTSRSKLKARLMDQSRLAGLGNLLTDETLWRASISPVRLAGALRPDEIEHLASMIRATVADLTARGGSHMGDLQGERVDGHCPLDGAELRRDKVGGRATIWCPEHQL